MESYHKGKDIYSLIKDQISKAEKRSQAQVLAVLYTDNADKKGSLKITKYLDNLYLRKEDKYPKTTAEANIYLIRYRVETDNFTSSKYRNYGLSFAQYRDQSKVNQCGASRNNQYKSLITCYKSSERGDFLWEYSGNISSVKPEAKNTGNAKQPDNETSKQCLMNRLGIFDNKPFQFMFFQLVLVMDPRCKDVATYGSGKLIETLCSMIIFLAKKLVI